MHRHTNLHKEPMIIGARKIDDSVAAAVVFSQRTAKLETNPHCWVVFHLPVEAYHASPELRLSNDLDDISNTSAAHLALWNV